MRWVVVFNYIRVNVKFPVPVQPGVNPVKFQVPVMALLLTVPWRASVFPLGVAEVIVSWKVPVILPLKLPLRMNDPVSVTAEVKQPVEVVNVRFVPVTVLPLLCVREVVNAKAGVLSALVKLAVQLPLSVFELELPPPHAVKIRAMATENTRPSCFITTPK